MTMAGHVEFQFQRIKLPCNFCRALRTARLQMQAECKLGSRPIANSYAPGAWLGRVGQGGPGLEIVERPVRRRARAILLSREDARERALGYLAKTRVNAL
jgi:hypothetical protein